MEMQERDAIFSNRNSNFWRFQLCSLFTLCLLFLTSRVSNYSWTGCGKALKSGKELSSRMIRFADVPITKLTRILVSSDACFVFYQPSNHFKYVTMLLKYYNGRIWKNLKNDGSLDIDQSSRNCLICKLRRIINLFVCFYFNWIWTVREFSFYLYSSCNKAILHIKVSISFNLFWKWFSAMRTLPDSRRYRAIVLAQYLISHLKYERYRLQKWQKIFSYRKPYRFYFV